MALKGIRAHIERLRALSGAAVQKEVGKALFAGGDLIRVEAQRSITQGSVSGKGHVPSRPGEPPNQDTGVLANNIETTQPSQLRVLVSSNAPYAGVLEFGGSKIAPRPYMVPARDKKKDEVRNLVVKAMNVAVKNSGRRGR